MEIILLMERLNTYLDFNYEIKRQENYFFIVINLPNLTNLNQMNKILL